MKKLSQNGFTAVEVLLVLILLAILGFTGFYVYHAQQNANKSLDTAQTTANSSSTASTKTAAQDKTKYLDIKEWGVKFPYSGNDTLTYVLDEPNNDNASIVSATLTAAYPGCVTYGAGSIGRGHGDSTRFEGEETLAQTYAANPGTIGKVGDYYYHFNHDQAGCEHQSSDASLAAQNTANDFVQAIVPKVVAE
jgi:prepilin-type N-terminal cleavage/methylation domain-containing protein